MKTIIIYSTKYGSVEKAAQKLKAQIQGEVDIINVKNSPDFRDYDTVILGSSIYASGIQKEMKTFLKNNLSQLIEKKVGLFICAGNEKENEIATYIAKNFTDGLSEKAIAKANLGYEYDLKKFSFIDRLAVRIVGGVKESKSVFHEEKIKDFAGKINS